VIPEGDNEKQEMIRITKTQTGEVKREKFGEFAFVPLRGNLGWS
jgi:protein-L-isoaspartate(D-aspartate) O-methyltransferase